MDFRAIFDWFAGGEHRYMTLIHCMNHDYFWIGLTVVLDLAVTSGYIIIALHWWRNERMLRETPAKAALANMKRIFLYCGFCGYLFIPIKMVWPAWRLYDVFLGVLVYSTWSYVLRSRGMGVVYQDLDRSNQLASDLLDSKNESLRKSEFFHAISHDMRTPLSGLTLHVELVSLHLKYGDSEAVLETLEQMRSCLRTTTGLLNRFLEVGRLDVLETPIRSEEVNLEEALKSIMDQFASRASEKGLDLRRAGPVTLSVMTDPIMLERILINLVDNAIKYTAEGGIEIRAKPLASGVAIQIVDTGEGITADDQLRIFDDFVQLDNQERDSRKGFGLGLPISRRLAGLIGGRLLVRSEPGHGSEFTLELPPAVIRSN